jgi:hypothetical protein
MMMPMPMISNQLPCPTVDADLSALMEDLPIQAESIASPVQSVQYVGDTSPILQRRGWLVLAWQICVDETVDKKDN